MKNYRDELMQDQNFIRCSVMIAELLLKYKTIEIEDTGDTGEPNDSPPSDYVVMYLILPVSSFIIYTYRKALLTKNIVLKWRATRMERVDYGT